MAETQPVQRQHTPFPWRTLIVAMLIAFMIAAGVVVWFVNRVASPVYAKTVAEQFVDYLPTVGSADGILETATATVPESFTRSDSALLFNTIPLGTTVSEIRVPVVYRYHIRLYDPWKLVDRGGTCFVTAPQFAASVPPAIVTRQMEKSTSNGWLRFNKDDNLAILEQGMTDELIRRADDKTHRDFVREACRQSVAEFVRDWLVKADFWRPGKIERIVVKFPDEAPGNASLDSPAPSITFDGPAK